MSTPHSTELASLSAVRRSRQITQTRLAASLGVTQSEVSRIERQHNLLIGTVRAYVVAVGAELELAVRFDDGERIVLDLT
jgi:transcriptional regulator with XRE-family HTH domain